MSGTSAPPFSFDCHRCGNCCRVGHGQVWFEESDLPAMASAFGIEQEAFVQRFVRRVGNRLSLMENADGSCSLLDGDSHCQIYAIRPKQCRDFPFWPQLTEGSRALERAAGYCQGIQRYPSAEVLDRVLPQVATLLDEILNRDARVRHPSVGGGDRWGSSMEIDLYLATAQERRIAIPQSVEEVRLQLEAIATDCGYPWSVAPWDRLLADRRAGWMGSGGLPKLRA